MADVNITKKALSVALKALMEERPFERISVSDICERCHMSRKNFYYHFKDKYDLANWIFDTEFVELTRVHSLDVMNAPSTFEEHWNGLEVACEYFYENRNFYRGILRVEGPNSFSNHFRDFLHPILQHRVMEFEEEARIPRMVMDFLADGMAGTIERWLLDKHCVTAEEFVANLKQLTNLLILSIGKRIQEDPRWVDELKHR